MLCALSELAAILKNTHPEGFAIRTFYSSISCAWGKTISSSSLSSPVPLLLPPFDVIVFTTQFREWGDGKFQKNVGHSLLPVGCARDVPLSISPYRYVYHTNGGRGCIREWGLWIIASLIPHNFILSRFLFNT